MAILFIAGAILFTTLMTTFFKVAGKLNIELPWAISLNYLICCGVGLSFSPGALHVGISHGGIFILLFAVAGAMFTINFHLMGINTRISGLCSTVALSRMSLVIPVACSALIYHEKFGPMHIIGGLLALLAVVLINSGAGDKKVVARQLTVVGALLFLFNGLADTLFKVFTIEFPEVRGWDFAILCFGAAFFLSLPFALRQGIPQIKHLVAGVFLGLFNFFALVCFLNALTLVEGPVVYPVNHIGTLVLTSLVAFLGFREPFHYKKLIGFVAAGLAIFLLLFPL